MSNNVITPEDREDAMIEMMDRQIRFLAFIASAIATDTMSGGTREGLKEVLGHHVKEIQRQDALMEKLGMERPNGPPQT